MKKEKNLTNPHSTPTAANDNVPSPRHITCTRVGDLVVALQLYELAERRNDRNRWVAQLGPRITACVTQLPAAERAAVAPALSTAKRDRAWRKQLDACFKAWCREGVAESRVEAVLGRVVATLDVAMAVAA